MGNIGMPELLLIFLFILIFFGAKKIPELAQSLGKGIREFRKAAREVQDEVAEEVKKVEEKGSSSKAEPKS
ncbi:MAG: twin-arginine translocase TatA/TatE family subunit [Bacteroidota bacterium]|jgi:sec-independent protein translocase protein TatA